MAPIPFGINAEWLEASGRPPLSALPAALALSLAHPVVFTPAALPQTPAMCPPGSLACAVLNAGRASPPSICLLYSSGKAFSGHEIEIFYLMLLL